jgi:hypothetical protein
MTMEKKYHRIEEMSRWCGRPLFALVESRDQVHAHTNSTLIDGGEDNDDDTDRNSSPPHSYLLLEQQRERERPFVSKHIHVGV